MAKIIAFPTNKNQGMAELLEEIAAAARNGEFKNFAFSAVSSDGETVNTAYYNTDPADKQYLASHIQIDAMYDVVNANLLDD